MKYTLTGELLCIPKPMLLELSQFMLISDEINVPWRGENVWMRTSKWINQNYLQGVCNQIRREEEKLDKPAPRVFLLTTQGRKKCKKR